MSLPGGNTDIIRDEVNMEVDRIIAATGNKTRHTIAILHAIQHKFNYLPEDALRRVSESSEISLATLYGVSTFYDHFRHTPVGKHMVHICTGTACHVKGAGLVYDAFIRELSIPGIRMRREILPSRRSPAWGAAPWHR